MTDGLTTIRGGFNGKRFLHALAVFLGASAVILLVRWAGQSTVLTAAIMLLGYPYALFLLISNLLHSFERIELGPQGLRRGKLELPWSAIRTVRKAAKEYQNRLGMKFPEIRLYLEYGDGKTLWFDSRWFPPSQYGRLEETIGRYTTIVSDFRVVPPPK